MKIYENDEIYVRPLLESDIEKESYLQWFYDQEVCKYNSHSVFSHGFDPLNITELDPKSNIIWAVMAKEKGSWESWNYKNADLHIGNVVLYIDWINRNAEFTCIFGEKKYWGKGYCTQVLKWIINHGFNKLGINKVWLGTAVNNEGMNHAALNAGMDLEAVLKKDVFLNGEYIDINRLSITLGVNIAYD